MASETDLRRRDQRPRPLSTFHFLTDPLTYTVSSVVRRLAEDAPPTPLGLALSANHNGSMSGYMAAMMSPPPTSPPHRRPSPFQPPPLTPLSLHGYSADTKRKSRLLTRALAEEIRLLIPPRLQLQNHWDLTYSMAQNGSTLSMLYSQCSAHEGKRGGFVLAVRDSAGSIFGAYLSDPPKTQPHYYGSGECFLWRAVPLPALPDLANLPPPPSEDTTHLGRMTTVALGNTGSSSSLASLNPPGSGTHTPARAPGSSNQQRIRFKAFPYTGENDFSIFCEPQYLSVGGGDGHYGLWLDDQLRHGVSQTCPTFGNEGLSEEGHKFEVLGVEVWFVG